MRQEAEPATDEVIEVAPGVLRLQLPIDMPGLGHVNTYAIEDSRGVALIDPGLPGRDSWQSLKARLADAGLPMARVHTVLVTHSHPDHYGGAGPLADAAGATIVTHRAFGVRDSSVHRCDDHDDHDDIEEGPPWLRKSPWGGAKMSMSAPLWRR